MEKDIKKYLNKEFGKHNFKIIKFEFEELQPIVCEDDEDPEGGYFEEGGNRVIVVLDRVLNWVTEYEIYDQIQEGLMDKFGYELDIDFA